MTYISISRSSATIILGTKLISMSLESTADELFIFKKLLHDSSPVLEPLAGNFYIIAKSPIELLLLLYYILKK